ncbi:MAG: hypothetical protein H3C27_04405 [Opitutaceae bacterium]|nr:hypothetical protein [Opitutaceae bacterium]
MFQAYAMIANFLQLLSRRPPPGYDAGFVVEVRVRRPPVRNPRVERFILICWGLIALKHVAVIYACLHWPVPFHQLWINAPTFALGLLATAVYYARR